jgi:hypothetical protein
MDTKTSNPHFIHLVAGFVLASMYFVYMFILLPRM